MTLLETRSLSVSLDGVQRLKNIDLQLAKGEMIGLIGPNGAGKSTLLKAIVGLLNIEQGAVLLQSQDMVNVTDLQRGKALGYLEQNGDIHWPLSVERLVELGRIPHLQGWSKPGAEDQRCVDKALQQTDTVPIRERVATTLSGGEKCRVLLARVLAGEPEILLADEPTAALDPAHQLMVMNSLRRFVDTGGAAIIAIHDLSLAARFCDKLLMLDSGERVAMGTPAEVLTEQRLASVYGVQVRLDHDVYGRMIVQPYALIDDGEE